MNELLIYILCINAITFFAFWHDKRVAMYGGWRVSEKTLLTLALVGGSIGALLASKTFRHKTRKQPFKGLLQLICFCQIMALAIFSNNPHLAPEFLQKYL